jgi:UDP-glucose 4-epimerase
MTVLVTGGAGYIGSHTCVELLQAGFDVHVLDNLSNSSEESLNRVRAITGRPLGFSRVDLRDADAVHDVVAARAYRAVIHFAGLKAVGESARIPLDYYDNNVTGTLNLCRAMQRAGVQSLIFSSSATVYGEPASVPIIEDFALSATNPYGRTKLMIEQILGDLQAAQPEWRVILLRYFNPVGAHPSGRIGEDPEGVPNNLMPVICQVAIGRLPQLQVFGGDYATPDGTGVRDYLHVVDLARGHVLALQHLKQVDGVAAYNLGTGRGYSVMEVVRAFERVNGLPIPYRVVGRRPGDIASCYADAGRARSALGWRAELGLDDMVRDAWRWQSLNPQGYR